jgi:DNA-binding Lrp family transcriptional regulator
MTQNIDKKELVLMSYLRQNSRMSLTKLSKKTGIPISSIFDKLKRRYGNIIMRHVSLLDFEQLGFSIKIHMLVKLGNKDKEECAETLAKLFNINNLYKVNNGYDYLFEALFRNLREVQQFNDALEKKFVIKKQQVHFIIDELKHESFMSDPALVEYVCGQ